MLDDTNTLDMRLEEAKKKAEEIDKEIESKLCTITYPIHLPSNLTRILAAKRNFVPPEDYTIVTRSIDSCAEERYDFFQLEHLEETSPIEEGLKDVYTETHFENRKIDFFNEHIRNQDTMPEESGVFSVVYVTLLKYDALQYISGNYDSVRGLIQLAAASIRKKIRSYDFISLISKSKPFEGNTRTLGIFLKNSPLNNALATRNQLSKVFSKVIGDLTLIKYGVKEFRIRRRALPKEKQ